VDDPWQLLRNITETREFYSCPRQIRNDWSEDW